MSSCKEGKEGAAFIWHFGRKQERSVMKDPSLLENDVRLQLLRSSSYIAIFISSVQHSYIGRPTYSAQLAFG